ncbi:MAG: isochorismatase family protein [Phycisphaerales bacterium]|nr:isochorismatase family protein [Phycisphaerales bacterium]
MEPGAILQVTNLKSVVSNLRQLFGWVTSAHIAVCSAVESHRPAEPVNGFPLHCIDGTLGQKKLAFTLLSPRAVVEADNYLSLPSNLQGELAQIIFRKRTRDVLGNPKADHLLTRSDAGEFILCGVGLEHAIKALALGLRAREKNVTLVSDACGYWSTADADLAIRQMIAKGVKITNVAEITAPQAPARRPGRPRRSLLRTRYPV